MLQYRSLLVGLFCATATADDRVNLATFDGASGTSFGWNGGHYPTMGGLSNMTVVPEVKALRLAGKVGSQKPLDAGYCNVQTVSRVWSPSHFNDASNFTHMQIRARSSVKCDSYKVSFGADASLLSSKTYKAPFALPADGTWHTVSVPFSDFTNDADTFTGDCISPTPSGRKKNCCTENTPSACPSLKSLQGITQLGIWMQGVGVDGPFDVEIESIAAGVGGPDDKPIAPFWPPKSVSADDSLVV